ncbi:HIT family protein [Methanoculleus sediminis]|uniref:HIT family protein n=1 Tax=Methanoculleus sediminis TaxID=1550566 RepID=UPI000ADB3488
MFGARLRTNRPGHLLIIPFRHVADFFDATDTEQIALLALLREAKDLLDGRYHPDGYNVGVNVGEAAGQTVMHLHVHVIPRYAGDVEDPRGGVRGAIPEKRVYWHRVPGRISNHQENAVCPAAEEVELPGFKRKRSSLFGWSGDPRVL